MLQHFSALIHQIQRPEDYTPPAPSPAAAIPPLAATQRTPSATDGIARQALMATTAMSNLPSIPTSAPAPTPTTQQPTTLVQAANNSPPTTFFAFFIHHVRTDPQARMCKSTPLTL